jgi:hypothetical protein
MLFSIGTILLILSLTMDYHHLPEVAFHSEIRRTILPFGIIQGSSLRSGPVSTLVYHQATYREMKLVSCYSNRLVSTEAEAFEIILHNRYLNDTASFMGSPSGSRSRGSRVLFNVSWLSS